MRPKLSPKLTFCQVEGLFIFLHRHSNRFFTLSGPTSDAFAKLVDSRAAGITTKELAMLRDRGIIVEKGRPLEPCFYRPPRRSLDVARVRPSFHRIGGAGLCLARALLEIRYRNFDHVVDGFSQSKGLRGPNGSEVLEEAASAVASFRDLGLYVSSADRCLPLSLALARILADRGVYADLVIGVSVSPFRAHAWVQLGDMVLNDTLDHVTGFQPVLAV